ncbi:uncharacterized protein AB675_2643 [Cyphellophora attinorum]|uniref:Uncharacterized protein n=1 Tax=Cyphellophora attinorum TaxID=1664694 RepID=A0A0N1HAT7_9EURO|nr:uncharacterized protein AB675_2643 [Phialophora attinorum]KPI45297.1 hypothetical protein AB675_2643 [Phialophora attinorum]
MASKDIKDPKALKAATKGFKTTTITSDDDIILESPPLGNGQTCPYHKDVLAVKHALSSDKRVEETLMERMLDNHPGKQSSIVALANSKLNITKGCTCAQDKQSTKTRL